MLLSRGHAEVSVKFLVGAAVGGLAVHLWRRFRDNREARRRYWAQAIPDDPIMAKEWDDIDPL
jgi:hypothetical protein